MRVDCCLCHLIPTIPTKTKLTLVVHSREVGKITNTSRLLARALPNSELRVFGGLTESHPFAHVDTLPDNTYLLYPDVSAFQLSMDSAAQLTQPLSIIVPDGNWPQARRMTQRIPQLRPLPRLSLSAPTPSRYQVRRASNPGRICTLEAVAQVLGMLEGIGIQHQLEQLLQAMVTRVMWTRERANPFPAEYTATHS